MRRRGMPQLDVWYNGIHVDSVIAYLEPADRFRFRLISEKQKQRGTPTGLAEGVARGSVARVQACRRPARAAAPPNDLCSMPRSELFATFSKRSSSGRAVPTNWLRVVAG